jgi:hypothetical protein
MYFLRIIRKKGEFMKLIMSLLVFTNFVFASTEFKGTIKGTSNPCSLNIVQVYYVDNIEKPENLRADVMASLEAEDHHISRGDEFFFTIKPGSRSNLFSGIATNQKDQLNVITKAGTLGLETLDFYAVKWLHGTHFHSAQCLNLKRVQE